VVARRPGERESLAAHTFDRSPRREQSGLERRLGAEGVRVDQAARRPDTLDEFRRVAAQDILLSRGGALDEVEPLVQRIDARLRLRMRAGRVEPGECAVAYEVDVALILC
jgi:hypothetical protein